MRSIKLALSKQTATGWDGAVLLTEAYLSGNRKANQLLEQLPEIFLGERRAICQSLFLGALRHGHRTRQALQAYLRKPPKPRIEAIFLVAGYEMLCAEAGKLPKIVHHAVERSKRLAGKSEIGFLNAVLRKLPDALSAMDPDREPATYFSHPQWLVDRWAAEFNPEALRKLLEWNQRIPWTYLKLYATPSQIPTGLEATDWAHFYRVTADASWDTDLRPLLNRGLAYIKDPSTRIAPNLLAPRPGETVLDLCAAPGGKAYDLAHLMQGRGRIVAVDLPGSRIARLRENLEALQTKALPCTVVESDVLDLSTRTLASRQLPTHYEAVMLDAPCSNTGVIQRRTDVKWRLQPGDIEACAKLQAELLAAAARFVQPGGRLVYSTCSIEDAENQVVVDAFLRSPAGTDFTLKAAEQNYPWESGHDGAGAFLLVRS